MLTEQLESTQTVTQPPGAPPEATTTADTDPFGSATAMDMKSMLRSYVVDAKRKREIEAELKAIETRMKSMEESLLNHFTEGGIQKTVVDGMTVYIHTDVWPRFREDENGIPFSKADVMDAMRQCGLSDYIQQTYNAQSFAAYVREMREAGGLPAPLARVVEISEKFSVRTRAGK